MDKAESDLKEFESNFTQHLNSLDLIVRPMVGRDISLHCPTVAMQLAERMQQIQPDHSLETDNTIAMALHRSRRYQEAADLLAQSIAKSDEASLGFDLYLQSMVLWRLGRYDESSLALRQADDWRRRHIEIGTTERFDLDALMYESHSMHRVVDILSKVQWLVGYGPKL